jgi:superfamily II DNA or RNA helicase/HKD family nuclease
MPSEQLPPGLYEELVTVALAELIEGLGESSRAQRHGLTADAAPHRLAEHVGEVVSMVLNSLDDEGRVETGVALVHDLLAVLAHHAPDALHELHLTRPPTVLTAIEPRQPDGSYREIERPLTSLHDTTLLVNAPGEPTILHELIGEIPSAQRIDVLMAFVRLSGIRPMLPKLQRHINDGGQVRLLTTTYTNSTELEALEALVETGAHVRVSYDNTTTRLHAKSWIFQRARGNSTAYVGSSNLTHSAMVPGLEWNVRLSGVRNPDVVARMSAVFETYWEGGDFVPFEPDEFRQRTELTATGPSTIIPPTELTLRPFQERLLERIEVARAHGHHRNLLAAATGTGKTVMAAVDYRRLRQTLPRARLLFVAHRQEILEQSLATFRHALHDAAFGELWVGRHRPREFEHVFASIQSLSAAGVESIEPDHFDVVIVDEFHHAAAPTYTRLLDRLQPRELLGLTATPERADGLDVLRFFDGRISAELRVWDAIDQQYLVPFAYYGIHDGLDLRDVPFRRGTGYDVDGLTNVYTANHVWVGQIIEQIRRRVGDPANMRALGFCVGVEHARFMSEQFNRHGIPAQAVWGESPETERLQALRDLRDGRLAVVFAVDLFNEGVDVPSVDTLLMFRPTESATLFLQQLGRGLRRADRKAMCTVLDFVGLHRKEFRFDLRYRALLGVSRFELVRQIERDFPFLPAGCHLELDPVARKVVLGSIKSAVPSNWPQRVAELKSIGDVGLARFLTESGLDLDDVYASNRSWTELRRAAGFLARPTDEREFERTFLRAIGRLLHVDDDERLRGYAWLVSGERPPDGAALPEWDRRLLRMLVASLFHQQAPATLEAALAELWAHADVRAELVELFEVLAGNVTHVQVPLDEDGDVPLMVHAKYTRREIQAAFGDGDKVLPPRWDSGVKWLPQVETDLLAFTLDKSSGDFSPTTRYRDYAISRDLIHWESQSVTSLASPTGQRYVSQAERDTKIMLFARVSASDRAFWFLGPARYVSHEGERPIAITWKLQHRLPADLFTEFAAAAVA